MSVDGAIVLSMTITHKKPNNVDALVLRQVTETLIQLHNQSGSINVGRQKVERLYVLHGMISHTLEAADAALKLIDSNHSHMARALARIAFEHAVVAQWTHLDSNGINSLQEKVTINYKKYYQEADRLIKMPIDIQEAFQAMSIPEKTPSELFSFENTCKSFVDTEWFYITYRILSGSVHPSNSTMRDYFFEDEEKPDLPILLNKANVSDVTPILFTLALSCVLAVGVYEDIRRGKPFKKKVQDIAKQANLPTMLKLKVKL
jgi:hypothetical protein